MILNHIYESAGKEVRLNAMIRAALLSASAGIVLASVAMAQMPATLVVTDKVKTMEFHEQVTLVGRTEAQAQSRIVAEVEGQVKEINALEGTSVNAGDPLITLDREKIRLAYEAKRAEMAQAKAQADLSANNLKRAEELFKEKLISESQLETRKADATASMERYNQLSADEKRLSLDLANCVIRAPFDGYTVRRYVNAGEWVEAGDEVFEMVNLKNIKINVDLPEKYFGHLEAGSKAIVHLTESQGEAIEGTVTGVAPSASQQTHTFPVFVRVNNSAGRLGSGMLVRVTLSLKKTFKSLAVSKDAIVRQGPMEQIYTIVEDKATPIPVRTVSTEGTFVAIAGEGLQEGMTIIVRGNERVYPGSPVREQGGPPPGGAGGGEQKGQQQNGSGGEES